MQACSPRLCNMWLQVMRTARHRADSLRELSTDLQALAPRSNTPTCTDRSTMLGFYTLLEAQASQASSSSSQQGSEAVHPDDAEAFHRVATGRVSVWEAWAKQFEGRYQGSPSLPPIETIYAKRNLLNVLDQVERGTALTSTGSAAGAAEGGQEQKGPRYGVRMDLSGTVLAEGKRKTSVAKVGACA